MIDLPGMGAPRQIYELARLEWRRVYHHWSQNPAHALVALTVDGILLAGAWILGGSLVLPFSGNLFVRSLFSPGLTALLFLLIGWQILQAPSALWYPVDVACFLAAPVPTMYLFLRISILLLAKLKWIWIMIAALFLLITHALHVHILLFFCWIVMLGCMSLLSTQLALLGTLSLVRLFGSRHMRDILFWSAFIICALPFCFFLLAFLPFPVLTHMMLAWFIPAMRLLQEPTFLLQNLALQVAGSPAASPISRLLPAAVVCSDVALLCLLAAANNRLCRTAYRLGWERLQISPDARQRRQRQTIRGGFLWELAWRLAGKVPLLAGIIGYCWQDARYDWSRWYQFLFAALLLLLVLPGFSTNALGVVLGAGVAQAAACTLAFGVGSRSMPHLFTARSWLLSSPVRPFSLFVGCWLAAALPATLLALTCDLLMLAFIHMPAYLALFSLGTVLVGSLLVSLIVVASSPFSIGSSVKSGSRLSALLSGFGSICVYASLEILMAVAAFLSLEPTMQRLIIKLLTFLIHIPPGTVESTRLFLLFLLFTGGFVACLTFSGWWRLRREFSALHPR